MNKKASNQQKRKIKIKRKMNHLKKLSKKRTHQTKKIRSKIKDVVYLKKFKKNLNSYQKSKNNN